MALMGLAGLVARYMLMALFGYWAFVMGLHLAFQFILLTFLHIFFFAMDLGMVGLVARYCTCVVCRVLDLCYGLR